jgi:RHS repeat-associated protein
VGEVNWLVSDHLGTPRMVADLSGSLTNIKRHDYLPFGEELFAGIGGRTTTQGYVSGNLRQGFTGYEKDGETGLNFAQARYYASMQGRFTSIDPLMASAKITSPQSWNRYAYVYNNPLRFIDPSGMRACTDASCSWSEEGEGNGSQGEQNYEARLQHQYNAMAATRAARDGDGEAFNELMATDETLTIAFVVSNVDELVRRTEAGMKGYLDADGYAQCARLPQAWENDQKNFLTDTNRRNRLTPNWIMGDALSYGMSLQKGTVVATFNRTTGKYARLNSGQGGENHTAIFLGWAETKDGIKGMNVVEQRSERGGRPQLNFIAFDSSQRYHSDASRFNVVRIANGYKPLSVDNNVRRTIME